WPSASDFATDSVPTLPLAPERASTSTGWPRPAASLSFSVRAIRSTMPPAGKGAMMRSGFEGKACAWTHAEKRIPSSSAAVFTSLLPLQVRILGDRRAQAPHAGKPAVAVGGLALLVIGHL